MTREEAKEELWNTRKDIVNFIFYKVDEYTKIGLVTRSDEGKLYNSSRTIIDKIYNDFESRTCESCKYFNLETGKQPDGLHWERVECELGIINQCMDCDYSKVSCTDWEKN